MRKILIIVLLFVVGLPSYTRNTKTFRQWGEESLKVIDTYLKSDKGTLLYCEKLQVQRRPSYGQQVSRLKL